jgi:sugar lactone lactonase YvrE
MGIDTQAQHVHKVGAQLGEGPVWVERDRALWFVDIKAKQLHRYDPAASSLRSIGMPDQPGFVVPVRGGGFMLGLKTGLHRFNEENGTVTAFSAVEPHLPGNRLNDGTVGPDGALWFGSMDDDETEASGSLYRMDASGRVEMLDEGYFITNGQAFSPDGRTFYHTDTGRRVIYAFDHAADGKLSGKRVFVQIEEGGGYPDGSAVDTEGCLWVALYAGWGVRRYSPEGELLHTVRFPCANVTKIAFSGADRRTAYATTASKALSASERAAQPLAGDLFSFRVDAPGLALGELVLNS